MKKISTLLTAMFCAVCLGGYAQTVVDIGKDWTGPDAETGSAIDATSGIFITADANTVNTGTDTEVVFNAVSTTTDGTVGAAKANSDGSYALKGTKFDYLDIKNNFTGHIEVSLTSNSAEKKITTIKLNGTTGSTSVAAVPAILFSDQCPFNENSIIGYNMDNSLAFARAGNAGFTITAPDNCKSFRIYRKATLEEVSTGLYTLAGETGSIVVGDGAQTVRIAYVSTTLQAGAPLTVPTISLATPGKNNQTVYANIAIDEIKYTCAGTATSIEISWDGGSAPAGIVATPGEKSLSITGTPSVAGTYNYSVVAKDATQTSASLTGTITVKTLDTTKKILAYVTALTSGEVTDGTDKDLVNALSEIYTVRLVSTKDALTAADFANDDLVFLSCFPGSGDQGIRALKGINKPFVSLKPFQFQWKSDQSNWGFGAPDNVPNTATDAAPDAGTMCGSVKVTVPSHDIFKGITLTNNELQFATDSKHTAKRVVTFMKGWHGTNESSITTLAVLPDLVSAPPALADGQKDGTSGTFVEASALATIFEITPGASTTNTYDGAATAWPNKNIFIGISEQVAMTDNSGSFITNDFKTLVKNACSYVLGGGNSIKGTANDNKEVVKKEYFDLTGKRVSEGAKGFIIEKLYYQDGTTGSKKVFAF